MTYQEQLDKSRIPQHVAIIMDGNGRWAEQQGKPRTEGHIRGVEVVRKIMENAVELGKDAPLLVLPIHIGLPAREGPSCEPLA